LQFKSGQFSVENWTPILGSLKMLQEATMDQVHKHFSDEQVAFLLQAYSQGLMTTVEVQEVPAPRHSIDPGPYSTGSASSRGWWSTAWKEAS
jgi:hypothetical protein